MGQVYMTAVDLFGHFLQETSQHTEFLDVTYPQARKYQGKKSSTRFHLHRISDSFRVLVNVLKVEFAEYDPFQSHEDSITTCLGQHHDHQRIDGLPIHSK